MISSLFMVLFWTLFQSAFSAIVVNCDPTPMLASTILDSSATQLNFTWVPAGIHGTIHITAAGSTFTTGTNNCGYVTVNTNEVVIDQDSGDSVAWTFSESSPRTDRPNIYFHAWEGESSYFSSGLIFQTPSWIYNQVGPWNNDMIEFTINCLSINVGANIQTTSATFNFKGNASGDVQLPALPGINIAPGVSIIAPDQPITLIGKGSMPDFTQDVSNVDISGVIIPPSVTIKGRSVAINGVGGWLKSTTNKKIDNSRGDGVYIDSTAQIQAESTGASTLIQIVGVAGGPSGAVTSASVANPIASGVYIKGTVNVLNYCNALCIEINGTGAVSAVQATKNSNGLVLDGSTIQSTAGSGGSMAMSGTAQLSSISGVASDGTPVYSVLWKNSLVTASNGETLQIYTPAPQQDKYQDITIFSMQDSNVIGIFSILYETDEAPSSDVVPVQFSVTGNSHFDCWDINIITGVGTMLLDSTHEPLIVSGNNCGIGSPGRLVKFSGHLQMVGDTRVSFYGGATPLNAGDGMTLNASGRVSLAGSFQSHFLNINSPLLMFRHDINPCEIKTDVGFSFDGNITTSNDGTNDYSCSWITDGPVVFSGAKFGFDSAANTLISIKAGTGNVTLNGKVTSKDFKVETLGVLKIRQIPLIECNFGITGAATWNVSTVELDCPFTFNTLTQSSVTTVKFWPGAGVVAGVRMFKPAGTGMNLYVASGTYSGTSSLASYGTGLTVNIGEMGAGSVSSVTWQGCPDWGTTVMKFTIWSTTSVDTLHLTSTSDIHGTVEFANPNSVSGLNINGLYFVLGSSIVGTFTNTPVTIGAGENPISKDATGIFLGQGQAPANQCPTGTWSALFCMQEPNGDSVNTGDPATSDMFYPNGSTVVPSSTGGVARRFNSASQQFGFFESQYAVNSSWIKVTAQFSCSSWTGGPAIVGNGGNSWFLNVEPDGTLWWYVNAGYTAYVGSDAALTTGTWYTFVAYYDVNGGFNLTLNNALQTNSRFVANNWPVNWIADNVVTVGGLLQANGNSLANFANCDIKDVGLEYEVQVPGYVNGRSVSRTIPQGSTYTVSAPGVAATQSLGGTITWQAQPTATRGNVNGGPCTTTVVGGGSVNLPGTCTFKYSPTAACTTFTDVFGIRVGEDGGAGWATKTYTMIVTPTAPCSGTFVNTAPVNTGMNGPATWTMPDSVASVSVEGPITATWATAASPVPTGTWSQVGVCTGVAVAAGNIGLPLGCSFKYVPSGGGAVCTTRTDVFGLKVGENGGAVWATKTISMVITPVVACVNGFVNAGATTTSLATATSFTLPNSALSATVAVPTTISWGIASGPVATGGSVSMIGGPCTTIAASAGQYGVPVGCDFKYIPTARCTDFVDAFGIAVGGPVGAPWATKTVSVSIPSTACSTGSSTTSSISATSTVTTTTAGVTYVPAPGDRVGVAAQGVTGEEISEAGTNTGGPIVVNGSGSMTASPQQASRNSPIVFTQTLTTSRSLGAYILDGIVIRQPGTPWTWTIVNGGLVSSPMGTNVGFNLTGVQITSAANGQVSVTFSLTPNTCDNKATCMINGTEAGLSTPTNFIADVTVKAYVESSPGVLQYENVVISAPFSVVGKPLVYVPAPDGKVGVVNNGTTGTDLNNAGTNTGGPILTPGTFGPDNNTTLVGTPVRFTQKLTSGRSLQGLLLNNVVVRRPGTGGIWTLVNGGVKVEPMASNVGFSLSNVVIAPSGTGDVEVSFDITPNVCANPTTCMLSQQDLQSLSTLFEVDLSVKGFAYAPGQTSGPLQAQEVTSTTEFAVQGNAPVVYGPAPGGLVGKAGTTVTSGDITSATINGGGVILDVPSSLTPGQPSIVIGATEQFTSSVKNDRLLKAFLLQNLVIQQTGTPYTWQLIKDGKLTSIGQGMGFNLDNVVIESLADGTVVAKFSVTPNVCNIKANCLMTIPESQNPTVIQYRVVLSLRGFADGGSGLVYQDLDQISNFNLKGIAVSTTKMTSTSIVIPTTGFTFNPTSNIAMNTLINGQDVAAATSLPTATATAIVSAAITKLTSLPVTTSLVAPTPIIFRAVYDAVRDSRPLLAAQVEKLVVSRVNPVESWTLVNSGVVTNVGKQLDFGSLVTINPDGSDGVAFVWFNGNTSLLGTGTLVADITMRWYVEATRVRRSVPLAYVQLSKRAAFVLGGTTSSTKSVTSTVKTTSVKTTTTSRPLPTNYIIAETCAPGKKYHNPLNCCCAPGSAGKVTKKVTATKTITVRKGAKVTGAPKRDLMEVDLMTKEDLRSRQDNGVVGQHLCQSCPLIGLKTNKKIYCCPRKVTVTRTVKTVYKTRTV